MIEPFFLVPVFFSFISLAGLALVVYAVYDILANQPQMEGIEKLIWIIVVLFFNVIGVLIYFLIVKYAETNPFEDIAWFNEDRKLDELERLADMKERGILTDEEFEKEKSQLLDEDSSRGNAKDSTEQE